jgi:hypothetical protein
MTSIWGESVARSLDGALELLAATVRDCSDELWEAPMWRVPVPEADRERSEVMQRHSMPWGVAWHALECVDYDLTGELAPWGPPRPFAGHPHWRDLTTLRAAWSRLEVLAYVEYCRDRARDTLAGMSDEQASMLLPAAHRYGGQPHAWVITALVAHTTEHAAQIRQFSAAAADAPRRA